MCEAQLESKYRELAQGRTVLESSLHLNLAEHLNSEIGLGTISNIALAKKWLRSSFLFQRIQRNPSHYAIATGENYTTIVDGLVLESIQQLERTQLVQTDSKISGDLSSTQFGEIMSKVNHLFLVGLQNIYPLCSTTSGVRRCFHLGHVLATSS